MGGRSCFWCVNVSEMKILYVDEAGCTGALPSACSDIQPVLAIVGLLIDAAVVPDFTRNFLALKRRFFLSRVDREHRLNAILHEVKGGELRKNIAEGGRRIRRTSVGFLDRLLDLLDTFDANIFGRVWIKAPGERFDGRAVYTYSVQSILEVFDRHLSNRTHSGIIVADSRNKVKNSEVAHSIFTMKFQAKGDPFPHVVELPLFGHSDNHAGLQVADLICSALVFPIAVQTYCENLTSVHQRDYEFLKRRFAPRLKDLQFRYMTDDGRWKGGLTVSDRIGQRSGSEMFALPDDMSRST